MGQTKTKLPLYERLFEITSRHVFDDNDRSVIIQAALELMPTDVRLMREVAAYAGPVALVSDVVKALGLSQGQSVVVGKALARLGYERKMLRLCSIVHPVWVKDCKLPLLALLKILDRQKEAPVRRDPEVV